MKRNDNEYRLQMIVVLVSKVESIFVLVGFIDTAGNAGQVVGPFVEVPIVQIILLLKYVLLYVLEMENHQNRAKAVSRMA